MGHKICFITYHYFKNDGQTISTKEFLTGIKKFSNFEPCLLTAGIKTEDAKELELKGIEVIDFHHSPISIPAYISEYLFLRLSKEASKYFEDDTVHVVTNDEALMVSAHKSGPMVYWSQGPAFLMAFSSTFYERQKLLRSLIALGTTPLARKYQKYINYYDLVLANSNTCNTLIAFMLGKNAHGIVYPPRDASLFKPNIKSPENYALWIAKRDYTYNSLNLIKELAKTIRIKIVGNIHVDGAETLGRVSDEELRELYANAYVTLYPIKSEIFGAIPVESMLSGTPVIAYNVGGPSETIINGQTGWLVNSENELMETALNIFKNGYDIKMREKARIRGEEFSTEKIVPKMLSYVRQLTDV